MKFIFQSRLISYLVKAGGIGLLVGLEPVILLLLGGKLNIVVFIAGAPLNLVIFLFQPILQLEEMAQLFYFLLSPIFYVVLGIYIGWIIYFTKNCRKNSFIAKTAMLIASAAIILSGLYLGQNSFAYIAQQNIQNKTNENQNMIFQRMVQRRINERENLQPDSQTTGQLEYIRRDLDIIFTYPQAWILEEGDLRQNEFRQKFKLSKLKDGLLLVVGVSGQYIEGGPADWFGNCAVKYKNMAEFCAKGCEKLNKNTSIDYRKVYHGDDGFSAMAYTDLSRQYPSMCFELDLSQIITEIAERENINYYAVLERYDMRRLIEDRKVSEDILEEISNFEKMAASARLK